MDLPVDDDSGRHGGVVAVGGVHVADVPEGVVLRGQAVRVRLVDLLARLEAVPHDGHAVALAPKGHLERNARPGLQMRGPDELDVIRPILWRLGSYSVLS